MFYSDIYFNIAVRDNRTSDNTSEHIITWPDDLNKSREEISKYYPNLLYLDLSGYSESLINEACRGAKEKAGIRSSYDYKGVSIRVFNECYIFSYLITLSSYDLYDELIPDVWKISRRLNANKFSSEYLREAALADIRKVFNINENEAIPDNIEFIHFNSENQIISEAFDENKYMIADSFKYKGTPFFILSMFFRDNNSSTAIEKFKLVDMEDNSSIEKSEKISFTVQNAMYCIANSEPFTEKHRFQEEPDDLNIFGSEGRIIAIPNDLGLSLANIWKTSSLEKEYFDAVFDRIYLGLKLKQLDDLYTPGGRLRDDIQDEEFLKERADQNGALYEYIYKTEEVIGLNKRSSSYRHYIYACLLERFGTEELIIRLKSKLERIDNNISKELQKLKEELKQRDEEIEKKQNRLFDIISITAIISAFCDFFALFGLAYSEEGKLPQLISLVGFFAMTIFSVVLLYKFLISDKKYKTRKTALLFYLILVACILSLTLCVIANSSIFINL